MTCPRADVSPSAAVEQNFLPARSLTLPKRSAGGTQTVCGVSTHQTKAYRKFVASDR